MKKHAIILFVATVISLPGLAVAQSGGCANQYGSQIVLAVDHGQPLTQLQADCMLDLIDFMAATVRGADFIQVDEPMRQIWRNHIASSYAMLAPNDRNWLLNSPAIYANWSVMWPQQTPAARETYRQTWAASLPAMMQFLQPVIVAARGQQAWQLAQSPAPGMSYAPSVPQTPDPVADYRREQAINDSLAVHNYKMNIYTTDLIHAMSGSH